MPLGNSNDRPSVQGGLITNPVERAAIMMEAQRANVSMRKISVVLWGALRYTWKPALGLGLLAVGYLVLPRLVPSIMRDLHGLLVGYYIKVRSRLIHLLKNRVIPSPRSARDAFRSLEDVSVVKSESHAHGALAANRAQAVAMMRLYALTLGRRLFMLQRSGRDVAQNIAGNRTYYWLKDTDVEYSDEKPTGADVVGIVDVDYYLDMPHLLAQVECPVILYTTTPTTVGEPMDDGLSFYFDGQDRIHVTLSGGTPYVHWLWDYGTDVLGALSYGWAFWRSSFVSYDVERRNVSKHSSLIALVPRHKWTGVAALVASTLGHQILKRVAVNLGRWNVLKIQTSDAHSVSISRVDSPVSATIPLELHEGIMSTVEVSKIPITISMVESQVTKSGISHAKAALLCAYYRSERPQPLLTIFPIERSIKRFQWREFDPEAKPALHPFMNPIVADAKAPDLSLGNEQQCVAERITRVTSPVLPITPQFVMYVEEFIALMVETPHTYVPADEEKVWEMQSRPAQQRNLAEASNIDVPDRTVRAFQKKEAYGKYTDPRNISTINPKDKLEYSRIVYSIAEIMKLQKWYAFGHTPRETAERVVEVCRSAYFVVPSDYSRLDGSISNLCRYLERALFMRAFAVEYHDVVLAAMRTQYKQKGVGTMGTKYDTGFSRLSGSPETSICNSLVTAFVPYMTFRETGMAPVEAFGKLGIYGGDDGLTPDIDPGMFTKCAKSVGLTLTAECVRVGGSGVHFLARFYSPDVWYGNPASCCDLKRQLSKFHTTVVGDLDEPSVKLIEKGFSYYLSDASTPILGPFVVKVKWFMDRMGVVIDPELQNRDICSYNTLTTLDDQYPNEYHEWFHTWAQELFPAYDAEQWAAWLEQAETIEDLLHPVCISAPEELAPPGVNVNGEVEQPVVADPVGEWSFVAAPVVQVNVRGSPSRLGNKRKPRRKPRGAKPANPQPAQHVPGARRVAVVKPG